MVLPADYGSECEGVRGVYQARRAQDTDREDMQRAVKGRKGSLIHDGSAGKKRDYEDAGTA